MIDFVVGFAVALAISWLARRFMMRRRYLAACEYWIYLREEQMPAQDTVMQQLLGAFWGKRGAGLPALPITPVEGRLMSDIRLHISLVLRSKNPHVFRPDLFGDDVEPTAALLESLAQAKALAKIRYVSEVPLTDRSLLTVVPAMAGTVAHLAGAAAVFDAVSERLQPAQELFDALTDRKRLESSDCTARSLWRPQPAGAHAEPRGLVKVGLPEISTHDSPADARVLICSVLESVIIAVWDLDKLPAELDVVAFGDPFRVTLSSEGRGPYRARVHRIQGRD